MSDKLEHLPGGKESFRLDDFFRASDETQRAILRAMIREEIAAYVGRAKLSEESILEAIAARAERDKLEDPGFKKAIAAFGRDEASAAGRDRVEGKVYAILEHRGRDVVS